MGAVHVVAPFRGGGAGASHVAFIDDGAVEYVFAEGKVQVVGRVVGQAEGLHGGEVVDCCRDMVVADGGGGGVVWLRGGGGCEAEWGR